MNVGCADGTYEHPAPRDTSLRIPPLSSHLHCAQLTGFLRSSGKRARSSSLLFDDSLPPNRGAATITFAIWFRRVDSQPRGVPLVTVGPQLGRASRKLLK